MNVDPQEPIEFGRRAIATERLAQHGDSTRYIPQPRNGGSKVVQLRCNWIERPRASPSSSAPFERKSGAVRVQLHRNCTTSLRGPQSIVCHVALTLYCGMLFAAQAQQPPPIDALPFVAPAPKDNPSTPEKIELGRLLFFDPILSATKAAACATCHQPSLGWTDGRATSVGIGGAVIPRNAQSILNVGFNGMITKAIPDPSRAPMFWDSRVESLEQQVFGPIRSREEMRGDVSSDSEAVAQAIERVNAIEDYRILFAKAFHSSPNEAVTEQHLAQAIATFERTLITPNTAFDRFMRGDKSALTPEQQRGMKVFHEAGCNQCHSGPMLSDYKLHFIGTQGEHRPLRTPTLRNLSHTAPFMHNGSQRTIRDVLTFYELLMDEVSETLDGGDTSSNPPLDPLLKTLNLKAEDFPALEAFLSSLSDDHYDQTAPAKVPRGLKIGGE